MFINIMKLYIMIEEDLVYMKAQGSSVMLINPILLQNLLVIARLSLVIFVAQQSRVKSVALLREGFGAIN